MTRYRPSRVLNESQNFAGINTGDIIGITITSMLFFYPALFFGRVLYAIPFILLLFVATAAVRQAHRRHFFRDTLEFFTAERIVDVTEYRRKNRN
jgi:hypothetical protein